MEENVRQVIAESGVLPIEVAVLRDDDDLFEAGMTSHASVMLMLALEDEFEIEFPERMLSRSVFRTVSTLSAAVGELTGQMVR
jgi:acyl carrier protein